MKIELVNHPEVGQRLLAWEHSRPEDNSTTRAEVTKLDLPVNEFTTLNLFIESTIVEREIITTMRDHVMWAQTSRVQNVLEFVVDGHEDYQKFYEGIRLKMIEDSKSERQDEFRLSLPLLSNTKYSISISMRNLVKLGRYFQYLSKTTKLKKQFTEFSKLIFGVLGFIGISEEDVKGYKTREILCESFPITPLNPAAKPLSQGIITSWGYLPMYLRAQLVRHRGIYIQDDFLGLLKSDSIFKATLSTKVNIFAFGTENEFTEVLKKRSCWIAHYRIWGEFLSNIERQMSTTGYLPCDGGSCPFSADALLRYEDKDPNAPCPIHLKLNNLHPTPVQKLNMKEMITSDLRPKDFWTHHINKL